MRRSLKEIYQEILIAGGRWEAAGAQLQEVMAEEAGMTRISKREYVYLRVAIHPSAQSFSNPMTRTQYIVLDKHESLILYFAKMFNRD